MKKNHLLFIILAIFATFTSIDKTHDYALAIRNGVDVKYFSSLIVSAPNDMQEEVIDTLGDLLNEYELSAIMILMEDDILTNYIHINDKKYIENFILENGSIADNLNTKSFYYSNFSNEDSERIYDPIASIKYEYIPLNKKIFRNNFLYLNIFSNTYNFENNIREIEREVGEKFNTLGVNINSTTIYENYNNYKVEYSPATFLLVFITCMIMLYTFVKQYKKISLLKLEGQSNIKIFYNIILKQVFITVLLSLLVSLIIFLANRPLKMSSSVFLFLLDVLFNNLGWPLIIYIVFSLIVLFLVICVEKNYSTAIKKKDDRIYAPALLLGVKMVVIISMFSLVMAGVNSVRKSVNTLFNYSKRVESLENVVRAHPNYENDLTPEEVDAVRQAIEDFYSMYTHFYFSEVSINISDDIEDIMVYYVVDNNYMNYHGIPYDSSGYKPMIFNPKGSNEKDNERKKEIIVSSMWFDSQIESVTLDREVFNYFHQPGEAQDTIKGPMVFDSYVVNANYFSPRIIILDSSYEDFLEEYTEFSEDKGMKNILIFERVVDNYKSSLASEIKVWTTMIAYLLIILVGMFILNLSSLHLISRNKNKYLNLNKNVLINYSLIQVTTLVIISALLMLAFKESIEVITRFALSYSIFEGICVLIFYTKIKKASTKDEMSKYE